jgi:hypothetical protein
MTNDTARLMLPDASDVPLDGPDGRLISQASILWARLMNERQRNLFASGRGGGGVVGGGGQLTGPG